MRLWEGPITPLEEGTVLKSRFEIMREISILRAEPQKISRESFEYSSGSLGFPG